MSSQQAKPATRYDSQIEELSESDSIVLTKGDRDLQKRFKRLMTSLSVSQMDTEPQPQKTDVVVGSSTKNNRYKIVAEGPKQLEPLQK